MIEYLNGLDRLREVRKRVDACEKPEASVRELLGWFSAERRGVNVVREIRDALRELNLVTIPDFEFAWIDGTIAFQLPVWPAATTSTTTTTPAPITSSPETCRDEVVLEDNVVVTRLVGGAPQDPAYRIGKLAAANQAPIRIAPDATLSEAVTVMLRNDFSQMPVMTSDREVKGVISWKSIASRLSLGVECEFVRDCMDKSVEIVDSDCSLFRVIETIAEQDFVLVRSERRIIGIVTTADLGESFYQLGRPFSLLGEIENHIRRLIDGKFLKEELEEAKNPGDESREIKNVADMSFGEYVRSFRILTVGRRSV